MADFLNLHPSLNTRTRHLTAGTRDPKEMPPANHPVSGFPLFDCVPNRQPLTVNRYFTLISFTNVSCGACLLVFQPPGSAV